MLEHEREYLEHAAHIVRTRGGGPGGFSKKELVQVADAVSRIRESIDRVVSDSTHTIDDWGFCLYLADSSYTDEEFCTIDPTGKAWRRHVEEVCGKCRTFLPRLKLKRHMTKKKRKDLAVTLDEAALALSNAHYAADEDDP